MLIRSPRVIIQSVIKFSFVKNEINLVNLIDKGTLTKLDMLFRSLSPGFTQDQQPVIRIGRRRRM
jgi:hypothetical protein